ncbi:MAG: divergent PAP2 family protein [Geitlerinemataceae cyanobacterium]
MQEFALFFGNKPLTIALTACFIAQLSKLLVSLLQHGQLDLRVLVGSGGMPSSHSALVTALAVAIGRTEGWQSSAFAIATTFAFIVMYDAAGVRQAAGKQAKVLNQIVDELFQENPQLNEEKLKELLGHTPFQVIVGAILGGAVACIAGLS